MNKQSKFNKISKDIKSVKIQGAGNIAKAGFQAYKLIPTEKSKHKLISLRPTEPMLVNLLKQANNITYKQLIKKLNQNQEIINKQTLKLIKNNSVIFTHCHSLTIIKALVYAKNKHKRFEVYNTETRPLYQGRKTARELKKAGIKVTIFTDSALGIALSKEQGTKKPNLILLGADAITKKGVINKTGSEVIAQIAKLNKIPVYILTDSLKYSRKKTKIEQRDFEEVWKQAPKNIKVKNPAFEFIKKKYITGIISELGTLKYKEFLKEVKK
jgi:translation initiation factor 2B subunit (eIF-2B alpha/beta/delta family)